MSFAPYYAKYLAHSLSRRFPLESDQAGVNPREELIAGIQAKVNHVSTVEPLVNVRWMLQ